MLGQSESSVGKSHIYFWLMFGALVTGLARGFRLHVIKGGSFLLDSYWAEYYLLNYRDRFAHRALVGSIVRWVSPAGASVVLINAVAVTTLFVLLFLFLREFLKLASTTSSALHNSISAVLLSSCIFGVLAETAGDLLQLCFVITALTFLAALQVSSRVAASFLCLSSAFTCALIHEGSALLLLPVLLLAIARGRLRLVHLMSGGSVMILMIWLLMLHPNTGAHLTYSELSFPGRHAVIIQEYDIYSGIRDLLHSENKLFFHSWGSRVGWLVRFGGVFLPFVAAVFAMAYLLPSERYSRFLTITVYLLIVSSPLYVVAHDWPRFLTFTFLLSVFAENVLFRHALPVEVLGRDLRAMNDSVRRWVAPLSSLLGITLLLQLADFEDYRLMGMPAHVLMPLLPLLLTLWFLSRQALANRIEIPSAESSFS